MGFGLVLPQFPIHGKVLRLFLLGCHPDICGLRTVCQEMLCMEEHVPGRKHFSPADQQPLCTNTQMTPCPKCPEGVTSGTVGQRRNEATSHWDGQSSQGGASHWPVRGPVGHSGGGTRDRPGMWGSCHPFGQSASWQSQPLSPCNETAKC